MCRKTILAVDDDPAILRLLRNLLTPEYNFVAALSGKEALRLALANPRPDLILVDVGMPEMDGYELSRLVKAESSLIGVPVVVLSGDCFSDPTKFFDAGIADCIAKPFHNDTLRAQVRAHLFLGAKPAVMPPGESLKLITPVSGGQHGCLAGSFGGWVSPKRVISS